MDSPQMEKTGDATRVDIIILNWNGASLLREYLPEVLATTCVPRARVIVADNGSTDDSLAVLAETFPGVETWRFDRNYGFAEGYNKALALSDAPLCVLLNSDVAPMPGWIDELRNYMDSHPDTGACQPKILSRRDPSCFEYAGAAGGLLDRNGYPYCRGRIFSTCETDQGQYDRPANVHWASGAALMVRRELYLRLGGLDPRFFAHMEEIDLCWRIRLAGYKVAAVPSAAVMHLGGGSLPASNPRKTFLNFRNNLLMLHKNLPDSVRSRTLLRRRLLDTIAWAKFVATADWANAKAVWRAHREFAKMRHDYTAHPDTNLLGIDADSRRNIIVDYYLRRHHRYSQL